MTTKIIITPANHGNTRHDQTRVSGTSRTIRVVAVGGSTNQNKTSVMAIPIPSPMRAPNVQKDKVRTVFKRLITMTSNHLCPDVQGAPKKRQRLDHLTVDQKNQRRKLKNRVAAQTARDRKKVQVELLESRVASLERQNGKILQQNDFLQKQNKLLSTQNAILQDRLQEQKPVAFASAAATATAASVESAAGSGRTAAAAGGGSSAAHAQPGQLGQLPDGAGHGRSQHADLLQLLTETLFGAEPANASGSAGATSNLVGTTPEALGAGHDTMVITPPASDTSDTSDELLAQLMCDDDEASVPGSPTEPAIASLSPCPSSMATVKTETSDCSWDMFDADEPLDSHFEDQLLLFPQLVL